MCVRRTRVHDSDSIFAYIKMIKPVVLASPQPTDLLFTIHAYVHTSRAPKLPLYSLNIRTRFLVAEGDSE